MAVVNKSTLKGYFEEGDIPSQGQYADFIDSTLNLAETDVQIIQGTLSASAGNLEYVSMKKLYLPGQGVDDMKVGSTFTIGKTLEVSGSLNVTDGTGSFSTLSVLDLEI